MLSSHRRFATRTVLALMLLTCGSLAYADSAWDGTWELNVAKSKFEPGPPLKSQTRTIKTEGDKQTQTIETVAADGKSTRSLSTYSMDGKDYPITGSAEFESLAAEEGRRVDDRRHAEARWQGGRDDKSHVVEGQENHDRDDQGHKSRRPGDAQRVGVRPAVDGRGHAPHDLRLTEMGFRFTAFAACALFAIASRAFAQPAAPESGREAATAESAWTFVVIKLRYAEQST